MTPPVAPGGEWLSVREMAEQMGVSNMTVYRLIHARQIPASRFGRNFRVKRVHWEQYLDYCATAAL